MDELNNYLNEIVCVICLASDRELNLIQDIPQIQELLPHLQLNINKNKLCWECASTVKKFVKFRKKALQAQQMFTRFLEGHMTSIKSISNLKWELMVDGVKIVTEDQSSRIQFKNDDSDEVLNENDDYEQNHVNNIYYEEIEYQDLDVDEELSCNELYGEDRLNVALGTKPYLIESNSMYKTDDAHKNKNKDELDEFEQVRPMSGHNDEDNNELIPYQYNKAFDIPKRKVLERCKVSRKRISIEELQQMLEEERENNIYKNAYFKCEKCVYGFDDVNQYTEHLMKHDERQGLEVCSICDQRFCDKRTVLDHYLHHFMAYYCTVCGYTSRYLRFLKSHQEGDECRSKKYPIWFYCDQCEEKFSLESLLTHHKKAVHEVKHACKYCNQTFTKDYSRKLHELIHKGRKSVQCDICKKFFVNKGSFQFHLKAIHNFTPKKSVYCKVCNKFYWRKSSYHAHKKSHSVQEENT
ncbi:zinc finger protein 529 [Amyelois transitella]|uniref:zinc finger protein 529 n=1 Tax=Amyelois transitella TaxID=680683 RepID=UPI00298F5464|nr:zinc finger protein 529 [Amyelois transitella]